MTDINLPEEPVPATEPPATKGKPATKTAVPHPMPVYKRLEDEKKASNINDNLDVFGVIGGGALLVLLGVWKLVELIVGWF